VGFRDAFLELRVLCVRLLMASPRTSTESEAIDGYGEKRNLDGVGRMVEAPALDETRFLEA